MNRYYGKVEYCRGGFEFAIVDREQNEKQVEWGRSGSLEHAQKVIKDRLMDLNESKVLTVEFP
jgi:hypothetical protein